jgi:uncharacterized protein involved in exopolysaccharide biosynthesis
MSSVTSQPPVSQSIEHFTLRDLVRPLFRYHRVFAGCFAVVFVLAMAFLMTRPKQYQSHMTVLVSRERLDPIVSTEVVSSSGSGVAPVTEEEINSEAELLRSRDVLEQVVRANNLQNARPGFLARLFPAVGENVRIDRAVQQLSKNLDIKITPKSDVLDVSYASTDPKVTYSVLNSLGEFYVQKHVAVRRAPGTYDFFAAETQRYQDAMNLAEQKLREFDQNQGLAAPDLQREGMTAQVTNAIGQKHVIEQAIAADASRMKVDQQGLQSTPARSVTAHSTTPPTMLLQQLGADLLKAQTKRTELAAKYNADYPLVQEADQELAQGQEAFDRAQKTNYVSETTDRDPTYELWRSDLARSQADLAAQQASLSVLDRSIVDMRAQMVALDNAALTVKALQRDAKANEDNYLMYLSKREQERASDALDRIRVGNVAIVAPPAIPALPEMPAVPAGLLAFALATLVSLVVTYTSAYLDPSFHAPEDISEMLGVSNVISISCKAA